MMTAVLNSLTDEENPLWIFRREMLPLGQPEKIDRHHAVTILVACFVCHDFKEEVALKKVTRDSIKTVCTAILKDRFLVREEGKLEGMAETATRAAMRFIKEMNRDAPAQAGA